MLKVSRLFSAKKISYEDESKEINERSKTPAALKAHKFQAAEWTFKNGHPRCKICGDEEPEGGMCAARKSAATYSMPLDDAIQEHQKLVQVLKSPDHQDDLEEAKEQGGELKEMLAKKASQEDIDPEAPYLVIDTKTGEVVGRFKYKDRVRARAFRDRKDQQYGAVRYTCKLG